ncbi:MAG: MipA/OmpV family protein [Pseudomonadota bacterium]
MTWKYVALLLAAAAGSAHAQATRMMMPEGTYDAVFGVAAQGIFVPGSDGHSRGDVEPALAVQWSNGVFVDAGTSEVVLGMHWSDNPVLDYGAMLSASGRDQRSDTPGERGGMALQTGAFINWHALYNVEIGGELLAGGGFERNGWLANARVRWATPLAAHHSATLTAGAVVADRAWMQGYFGVTQAQSASGGNRLYHAPGGVLNVYGDVEWQWQLANKYWLYTGARLSRRGDGPANSPLVGSRRYASVRTALTYHF